MGQKVKPGRGKSDNRPEHLARSADGNLVRECHHGQQQHCTHSPNVRQQPFQSFHNTEACSSWVDHVSLLRKERRGNKSFSALVSVDNLPQGCTRRAPSRHESRTVHLRCQVRFPADDRRQADLAHRLFESQTRRSRRARYPPMPQKYRDLPSSASFATGSTLSDAVQGKSKSTRCASAMKLRTFFGFTWSSPLHSPPMSESLIQQEMKAVASNLHLPLCHRFSTAFLRQSRAPNPPPSKQQPAHSIQEIVGYPQRRIR